MSKISMKNEFVQIKRLHVCIKSSDILYVEDFFNGLALNMKFILQVSQKFYIFMSAKHV